LLAAPAAPLSTADRSFVDRTVMRAMVSDRLPGVSISISGPRGSYERAYGVGNLATGAPLRLSDRVRSTLGDLTKWGRVLATGTLLSRRLQAERMRFGTIPTTSGIPLGYGLGITRLGDWVGHNGAILGFSTETFYHRVNGAEITAAANLSSNFSVSTTDLFLKLADALYPQSPRTQR
jgi:D-alanyl-D-alanine carboxypeptidase